MRTLFLLFVLSCIFSSCKPAAILVNPVPIQLEWIVGIWKDKDKEFYEKWVKVSATEYTGIAYDLDQGFANVHEYLRIFKSGSTDWYLEAKVKENNFAPVLFKWNPDPVIELKFVNEKHDFPQVVMYHREAYDVMTGSISNLKGDQVVHTDYMRFATK